jgi:tripartite-type tricarboxylate transporter receptor subunit TctC
MAISGRELEAARTPHAVRRAQADARTADLAAIVAELQAAGVTSLRLALLPMARGRQIKALATTAAQRSVLAPDIATAAESGMPGLEFASWYGVWGPARSAWRRCAMVQRCCQ